MNGGEIMVQAISWERMNERDVVLGARGGNREAFGELVRTHRSQVYGWANKLTRDAYLADNIVQEAFIDAYVQMGSLLDEGRFSPWLRTIVRNRAYMKLRRGGRYRREQPASDMTVMEERSRSRSQDDTLSSVLHKERAIECLRGIAGVLQA